MRNAVKYKVLVFAAALLLMGYKGIAQQTATDNNLVWNPGFETGENPWQLDNWMGNIVSAERDNQNPHGGQWAMKVQLIKVVNSPMVMYAFPHLHIRPRSAIQLKFWARGVSNGANLTVMIRREVEPRITYLRTEMNLTDEWQEHTYTIQFPEDANPDATSLRFVMNQTGVFWIDDISAVELPPMDNGPAPTINTIRNPSFEVGNDGWTATFRKREFGTMSQESGNGAPAPDDAKLDVKTDKTAPDGQRYLSFKIDKGCRNVLTSAYFPARYGHKGTLNFSLRADSIHAFEVGVGGGINSGTSVQTQPKKSSAQWEKYSVPFTLKPSQDGIYFVDFHFNEAGQYDLDAVSFVEDELPNVVRSPPSAAIQALPDGPVANLYAPNQPASFKLVIAADKPNASNNYQVTVLNFLEQKIATYPVSVPLNEKGYGEKQFEVPSKLLGAFRIEVRPANGTNILAEQLYSVLPPLPPPGERPESFFGGHVDFTPYNLEIARRGGFRWLRMWPPLVATWIAAEPKPGVWNFQTADVERASKLGFQISGILGTAPDFKADINTKSSIGNRWSHAYPPSKISDWKEYVAKCYTAFYPYIKTWEVWNEPDGGYLQVKPELKKVDVYNNLLKASREVLDSIGKPVTLIGPAVASINASLGWEVLQHGGGKWMDAFSFHFYSLTGGGDNPDDAFVLPLLKKFRTYKNRLGESMPLWHSEGGMYLQGAQSWLTTYRIPTSSPVKKPAGAASMVRAALFFKSMGVKHYFDFELSASAAGREVNSDLTAGFIEVTGIPGPGIAAHAAMVSLTEDASGEGFEDIKYKGARLKVAHFKNDKGAIDAYWSDLPLSVKDAAKLTAGDKVLDMMGNPVAPETSQTGEFPLYVIRAKVQ